MLFIKFFFGELMKIAQLIFIQNFKVKKIRVVWCLIGLNVVLFPSQLRILI